MISKCLLAAALVLQVCWAMPSVGPQVTDGKDAKPHEYPYQVSIQWGLPPLLQYRHVCGGSIINEKYILSAGHCALKIGKFRVAAGKHHITQKEETEQVVEVEKAIQHKDYKGGVNPHDIALFKLKAPLTLNKYVAAIKLPKQDQVFTGQAVLTGWGSTSKKILPVIPKVLQTAEVPLLTNEECYKKLTSKKNILGKQPELFETQVCSGNQNNHVSACSGDSGGPLAQYVDGVPHQVGIVSWGFYPCGSAGAPSVFTRVASYVNWIHNIMDA